MSSEIKRDFIQYLDFDTVTFRFMLLLVVFLGFDEVLSSYTRV